MRPRLYVRLGILYVSVGTLIKLLGLLLLISIVWAGVGALTR